MNHAAGLDGLGGSSYIDDVILRDADEADSAGPAWSKVTDGTLEDRLFYLQNWRADVVVTVREAATTGDAPALVDHVRYSSYGVPWGTSMADLGAIGQTAYAFAPDGQITVDDSSLFSNAYNDNDLLADVTGIGGGADQLTPPDGQLTVDDVVAFYNAYADDGGATGRGVLSRTHSRRGYAGYEYDPGLWNTSSLISGTVPPRAMWHVRNRVLDSETGRWTRRDPLGYVDGMSQFVFARGNPTWGMDPSGLITVRRLLPPPPQDISSTCGSAFVTWEIRLTNPAPCDGFLIQQVTRVEEFGPCETGLLGRETIRLWEIWRVRRGQTLPDVPRSVLARHPGLEERRPEDQRRRIYPSAPTTWTDNWILPERPNTVGTVMVSSEQKFYCNWQLGPFMQPERWPSHPNTGHLPGTNERPWFWSSVQPIESGNGMFLGCMWKCCRFIPRQYWESLCSSTP